MLLRFKELNEDFYRPKGTSQSWWKKLPRSAQVLYRRAHPSSKMKARLADIEIDRETLNK